MDKSSTYLAEVTKPLSQMDTILAKLDDLDVHREWTSEDKEITKSKVNELTKGEKITTSFEADAKGKHVQCEVQIIRIAEDELMLRIICSDEELASEMQQHLQD